MSIKAKLILSLLVEVSLVVLVGAGFVLNQQAEYRAGVQATAVAQLNTSLTDMRFITFENLLNHDDRSLEQWQLKYRDLLSQLASHSSDTAEESHLRAAMLSEHYTVKSLFDRLADSYQGPATDQSDATVSSFRERLAGQLLVSQQAQVTQSAQLASLTAAAAHQQRLWYAWLSLAAILLMLVVTVGNAWIMLRTITSSLQALQTGAGQVAIGNLSYRIRLARHDEFGQLATAFNAMAASLKQIDQTKSEFIVMASHQLRTPATAVKGFVSLLIDGYMGAVSADQAGTLHSALAENERQLKLIDEMLVVAQAETGEMKLAQASTDLVSLLNTVVAAESVVLASRKQSIRLVEAPDIFYAKVDAEKVRAVLENLITNASNYSAPGTAVEISLSSSASEAIIKIQDQGFGIAKADQSKLFKKFSRLANTGSTRIEGAGLGLYLAKKIVDLHHGSIHVQSEVGRGSTFTVRLPRG